VFDLLEESEARGDDLLTLALTPSIKVTPEQSVLCFHSHRDFCSPSQRFERPALIAIRIQNVKLVKAPCQFDAIALELTFSWLSGDLFEALYPGLHL
jgi:hypothetical protein